MKNTEFIAPIILATLLASCSGSQNGQKANSRNTKDQKIHTFVAPPPQQRTSTETTSASQSTEQQVATYDNDIVLDTSAHFEISKYAYYEVSDSNQRQVKPELIEKYRRARNSNTYVNLYPTDWAGIMKDRGLKPVKEKKTRVKKQRRQHNYYGNNYYGNNYNGNQYSNNYYRPRGLGIFPIFSYGWNSQTGWAPNIGLAVGPRSGWGPYGTATWGGRRRGMNYNMGMPMYYNNIYNQQPYGYGNQYGNAYYNNVYNYVTPVPVSPVVQTNAPQNNTQVPAEPKNTKVTNTGTDWSDGTGGPEKYTSKTKKIEDYKVE